MRNQLKLTTSIICALALVTPGIAQAKSDQANVDLLVGPPVSDVRSPYEPALECINTILTPQQRHTTFTVQSFPDKTSKANFVSDSGVGSFSSQGMNDMLYTSLALAGVQVTDMSPQQREFMDWSLQKIAMSNMSASKTGNKQISVGYKFPDVSISGAITTFDINVSSGGFTVRVAGIGGSHHKSRILVGMDAHLTQLLGSAGPDGQPAKAGYVPTVVRINKQIVGYNLAGGATRFFGNGGGATLVDFDLGGKRNEAIQYMERVMADGMVARLLTKYFGITGCNDHIAYGDKLLVPPEPVNGTPGAP